MATTQYFPYTYTQCPIHYWYFHQIQILQVTIARGNHLQIFYPQSCDALQVQPLELWTGNNDMCKVKIVPAEVKLCQIANTVV